MMKMINHNYCLSSLLISQLRIPCFLFQIILFITPVFSVHAEGHEEYDMFNITAGQVGIADNLSGPQRYGVEYRFKPMQSPFGFHVIPGIGAASARNGANFIYVDIKHDFYLDKRWYLIPSFGIGGFRESDEIKLGSELEFRTGLELAYQFKNKYRIGVAIFHLSNGGIADPNPGTESLVLSVCIPINNR